MKYKDEGVHALKDFFLLNPSSMPTPHWMCAWMDLLYLPIQWLIHVAVNKGCILFPIIRLVYPMFNHNQTDRNFIIFLKISWFRFNQYILMKKRCCQHWHAPQNKNEWMQLRELINFIKIVMPLMKHRKLHLYACLQLMHF